jgi:hypothetical protein
VNTISTIDLAAALMSPEYNPIRPDNVATRVRPSIHLAAFHNDRPNHSRSHLKMPVCGLFGSERG